MSFMARHFPRFNFYFHKPSPEHCGGIPNLSEVIFSLLASGEEAISKVVAAHHPNVEVPLLGPGQTVGLSWFSTSPNYGKLKSLKAREVTQFLARAKKAGVRVLSLHAHDEIAQVPEYRGLGTKLSGLALEWPLKTSTLTGSLDQLADVIAGCDAIVSVPNTTAHLASALGKRVSVLQRAFSGSHWYWTNDAIYSRFYPHTTINRFFDEFPAAIDLYFPEG